MVWGEAALLSCAPEDLSGRGQEREQGQAGAQPPTANPGIFSIVAQNFVAISPELNFIVFLMQVRQQATSSRQGAAARHVS